MPDRQRLISASIAIGYLFAMWRREGWAGTLALLAALTIPLGMIWYAGSIGRSKGWGWGRGRISRPSPPIAVRTLGWLLLLLPLVVLLIERFRPA